MRGLVHHRGKAEELACGGLVNQDLLMIVIENGDADGPGDQEVRPFSGVANFIDSLMRSEFSALYLSGENSSLLVIE